MTAHSGSVFRSAITGDDNTVDPGYLALFWTMTVTVGIIPLIVIVGGIAVYHKVDDAAAILQAVGIAVGAVCTGAGVVIGAVGAFRLGDKPRAGTTTTVAAQTTVAPETTTP